MVTLYIGKFDKYGRPLVECVYDKINISDWMLDNHYGYPYNGSGEKQWKSIEN